MEEFKEIIDKAKKAGKCFATSFPLRHSPFFLKLFSILRSGELGEIISIDCNQMIVPGETSYLMTSENRYRSKLGSMFLEKSAPIIDIICWLLQSIPMKVASFGGLNVFTPSHLPSVLFFLLSPLLFFIIFILIVIIILFTLFLFIFIISIFVFSFVLINNYNIVMN